MTPGFTAGKNRTVAYLLEVIGNPLGMRLRGGRKSFLVIPATDLDFSSFIRTLPA